MSWNNRICKTKNDKYEGGFEYGIHEVYYDENGTAHSMTVDPIGLGNFESSEELMESLKLIWEDANKRPIFEVPDEWNKNEN